MTAWRRRWLYVKNRLEELLWKLGPPPEPPAFDIDPDPSWGPLGSLARRQMHPEEYAALLALHQAMLRQERARGALDAQQTRPAETPTNQPRAPRAAPGPPVRPADW